MKNRTLLMPLSKLLSKFIGPAETPIVFENGDRGSRELMRIFPSYIPIGEGTTNVFEGKLKDDIELYDPDDIELIFVIFETGLTYYATESEQCPEFWPFLAADPHFIEHGNNPSFPSVRITPSSASTMLSRTTFVTGGASET